MVFLPLIILLFPVLFIYAKSVEESCMIVEVSGSKVTVGDWLYEEVIFKVNGLYGYPILELLQFILCQTLQHSPQQSSGSLKSYPLGFCPL